MRESKAASKKKDKRSDPSAVLCPLYSTPSLHLPSPTTTTSRVKKNKQQLQLRLSKNEDGEEYVRKLSKIWGGVFIGPIPELCEDIGWLPGKAQQLLDTFDTARYGGWYDQVMFSAQNFCSLADTHTITPFLPRPLKITPKIHLDKLNTDTDVDIDIAETDESLFDIDPELLASVDDALDKLYDISNSSITLSVGLPMKSENLDETEGTHMAQATLGLFESARLSDYIPDKPGFFFNAGGFIRGMGWCPLGDINEPQETEYLAVSAVSSHERLRQARHTHKNVEKPGLIQIWSLTGHGGGGGLQNHVKQATGKFEFSLGVCVDVGEAISLKWCPKGGVGHKEEDKIGIIAGCFTDGSISLFAVPEPESARVMFGVLDDGRTYIRPKEPLLYLALDNTSIRCFDWASHRRIVAGCTDGHIAVYDIEEALRTGQKTAKPVLYSLLHQGAVQSVNVVRAPSRSDDGEPNLIVTMGYDGNVTMVNLEQIEDVLVLCYERGLRKACAFTSQSGGVIMSTATASLEFRQLQDGSFLRSFQILDSSAPCLCIATSDVHPFYSVGASDGSCSVFCLGTQNRRTRLKQLYYTVYKMEMNRKTGKFRMIDNLVPFNTHEPATYGIWDPTVGVQTAAWHPSVRLACLMGSGTGCGIGRIDWVEGWAHERGGEESSDD